MTERNVAFAPQFYFVFPVAFSHAAFSAPSVSWWCNEKAAEETASGPG